MSSKKNPERFSFTPDVATSPLPNVIRTALGNLSTYSSVNVLTYPDHTGRPKSPYSCSVVSYLQRGHFYRIHTQHRQTSPDATTIISHYYAIFFTDNISAELNTTQAPTVERTVVLQNVLSKTNYDLTLSANYVTDTPKMAPKIEFLPPEDL